MLLDWLFNYRIEKVRKLPGLLYNFQGFEVKVTEALHKGIPLIAYKAGGIPLQLPADYPYLVEVGNIDLVAKLMLKLLLNDDEWKATSEICRRWGRRETFWTGYQCVNWLWLFNRVTSPSWNLGEFPHPHWVDEEWRKTCQTLK